MEDMYPKAYREVNEILKHMPQDSVNKIPIEMRLMFEKKMDLEYDFKVDEDKLFNEQELLTETKAILVNLYRDYWASDEEREEIIQNVKCALLKEEEEKRKKYNPDDLFATKQKVEKNVKENNLPIDVKKANFFSRFIKFIKNFLNIN